MAIKPTIIFTFAGRRGNMEIQLPIIQRILETTPQTQFHIWNLSHNELDNQYIRSIRGDGIIVRNEFYGTREPWLRFNDVYRHYCQEGYSHVRFVKIDDDVVFLESGRFNDFLDAIDANPHAVMSAKVVNNGACTPLDPGLWNEYKKLDNKGGRLDQLPLLDVHLSVDYALACHNYLFNNWPNLIGEPIKNIPTTDWLSINLIGYDWTMGRRITGIIGTPFRYEIAGRNFMVGSPIGDEGAVNCIPRIVMQGFLAGHLYFGPQAANMADDVQADLRKRYAELGRQYLA